MWQTETTTTWERDHKHYAKKHPNELAAVLRNLSRYVDQINASPNAKSVQAGYLHHEPLGVVAIDQKGSKGNLQETRLYTYACEERRVLYLITIGNKAEQSADIELSKEFVKSLLPET
jgi:hypothetical protein